jgi:hypothetical protein
MSDMIYYKNGEETFRISPPTVETKCPKTKLEVKKMTEKERIQGEIKILQSKLALLEELDRVKSPAEEAFKRVYYRYPDKLDDKYGSAWDIFEKGYEAHQSLVDDANKIIAAASMTNCTLEGNPPNGCSAWSEWFELFGSNGILHNLRISTKEYQPTPQEPEENKWKTVALRFGETLSSIGPCGYYEMTADEWLEWANDTYEKNADELLTLVQRGIRKNEVKEYQPKEKEQKWGDIVRESVKWCEEHREESVEDYLKPHTPEQVDAGLRNAMRQAKKDGVFDEPTKPMNEVLDRLENKYENDEVVNRMLKKWEENPPDFLKFELGKTLEALITRWWCDVFTTHEDWDMETAIDDLCDRVELWLPKSQSHKGTQSSSVIDLVDGYNDALTKIKSKLRNKK